MNEKCIFFLLLISIELISSWKCGKDLLKIKPKGIDPSKFENKRRLSSEYQSIRIMADYSNLKTGNGVTSEIVEKIKKITNEVCDEFSRLLKVVPINSKMELNGEEIKQFCELDNLDNNYQNFFISHDLVIFPSFDSTLPTNVLAAAGMCMYLTQSYRPIFGVLNFNPNLSFSIKNTDLYMKILIMHELTHVLVFSPDLFELLGMLTTKIFDGSFVSFINSPKVLTAARQHYNCESLNGVPLENQGSTGSAGSHWESRYMLGDYMISTDYMDNVISDITLALFEDSKIYKVNYYSGSLFKFGKNMGCSFFDKKCIEDGSTDFKEEFCTKKDEYFCSRSKINKGKCIINEFSKTIPDRYRYFDKDNLGGYEAANYCPVSNNIERSDDYYPSNCHVGISTFSSEYGEIIGNSSFCFISSLLPNNSNINPSDRAICYKVECDSDNLKIIVNIGNNKVYCPTEGGIIDNPSGFKGTINCPEYYEICGQETEKEGDICNDMFDCIHKKAETNINTISFFPEEDYVIQKRSKGYNNFRFNFNLIILLLILFI